MQPFVKPDLENRDGDTIVRSRIGLTKECILWSDFVNMDIEDIDKIIIDEAHFLKTEDIDYLGDIVDKYNIDVICFGLKTNYKSKLFEGSKRLVELADKFTKLETICSCGIKARFNARKIDGKYVFSGKEIMVDNKENVEYVPLCGKCYYEKVIKKLSK